MSIRAVFTWLAFASLLALSCASVKPLYSGDRRPRDQVGELRMNANGAITNINGLDLEGHAYELLPGKYAIQFRSYFRETEVLPAARDQRRRLDCSSALEVEGGHEYRITADEPKWLTGMPRTVTGPQHFFDFAIFVVDFGPDEKPIRSKRAECAWK